uniref:Uncharacterized protein n=1 Tax=Manihot esculenta TaxID=3983 RepID=A0A199UC01_MANES
MWFPMRFLIVKSPLLVVVMQFIPSGEERIKNVGFDYLDV